MYFTTCLGGIFIFMDGDVVETIEEVYEADVAFEDESLVLSVDDAAYEQAAYQIELEDSLHQEQTDRFPSDIESVQDVIAQSEIKQPEGATNTYSSSETYLTHPDKGQEWIYISKDGEPASLTQSIRNYGDAESIARHEEMKSGLYERGHAAVRYHEEHSNKDIVEYVFADKNGRISHEVYQSEPQELLESNVDAATYLLSDDEETQSGNNELSHDEGEQIVIVPWANDGMEIATAHIATDTPRQEESFTPLFLNRETSELQPVATNISALVHREGPNTNIEGSFVQQAKTPDPRSSLLPTQDRPPIFIARMHFEIKSIGSRIDGATVDETQKTAKESSPIPKYRETVKHNSLNDNVDTPDIIELINNSREVIISEGRTEQEFNTREAYQPSTEAAAAITLGTIGKTHELKAVAIDLDNHEVERAEQASFAEAMVTTDNLRPATAEPALITAENKNAVRGSTVDSVESATQNHKVEVAYDLTDENESIPAIVVGADSITGTTQDKYSTTTEITQAKQEGQPAVTKTIQSETNNLAQPEPELLEEIVEIETETVILEKKEAEPAGVMETQPIEAIEVFNDVSPANVEIVKTSIPGAKDKAPISKTEPLKDIQTHNDKAKIIKNVKAARTSASVAAGKSRPAITLAFDRAGSTRTAEPTRTTTENDSSSVNPSINRENVIAFPGRNNFTPSLKADETPENSENTGIKIVPEFELAA